MSRVNTHSALHSMEAKTRREKRDLRPRGGGAIAGCLFVMRPHADDLDRFSGRKYLVDEAVLDVDSARVGAGQIADELLKRWWVLEGVSCEEVE